jgi:hypothetical protein
MFLDIDERGNYLKGFYRICRTFTNGLYHIELFDTNRLFEQTIGQRFRSEANAQYFASGHLKGRKNYYENMKEK